MIHESLPTFYFSPNARSSIKVISPLIIIIHFAIILIKTVKISLKYEAFSNFNLYFVSFLC
jgi:hypothetical protein